ncbi:hypothetical protein MNBD_ALPHA06-1191 [hydrothermal vent metagenome]|uniref:Ferrous iron transporter FeoA-like domain-containing protein n=1 Tax=hydrothermal vent metagenome TaxID=652676 RepID=A0A3B0R604_9ZZZZ
MSCNTVLLLRMIQTTISLDQLPNLKPAKISGFCMAQERLIEKLREIGFAEGDEVEILHRGLLGGSPISVRLDRCIIALRKSEAAQIQVICLS